MGSAPPWTPREPSGTQGDAALLGLLSSRPRGPAPPAAPAQHGPRARAADERARPPPRRPPGPSPLPAPRSPLRSAGSGRGEAGRARRPQAEAQRGSGRESRRPGGGPAVETATRSQPDAPPACSTPARRPVPEPLRRAEPPPRARAGGLRAAGRAAVPIFTGATVRTEPAPRPGRRRRGDSGVLRVRAGQPLLRTAPRPRPGFAETEQEAVFTEENIIMDPQEFEAGGAELISHQLKGVVRAAPGHLLASGRSVILC
ncbi:uncharacterized protein LOC141578969 [Camelus bactrianus]|uniref:Uncharacterized protein LOC141578969 n=1 Tax=Camelus bactrianus TaxID=9837 RepID=A0AC58R3S9_CAMBA